MILKITKFDDPVWKKPFKNIPKVDKNTKDDIKNMDDTLVFSGGVGIAAPQAGLATNCFIVLLPNYHEVFINPKITKYSKETDEMEEGCLSIPGYRGLVPRSKEVSIEYTGLDGKPKEMTANGFLARVLQHEYDHLQKVFYANRVVKEDDFYEIVPIKIVFFGSPDFAATILTNIIGQGTAGDYQVQLVVTQPDKPGHRNQLTSSAVKKVAEQFVIPVITPDKLTEKITDTEGNTTRIAKPELVRQIKKLKPDVFVVASYGKILPIGLLKIPKKKALNIHGSMLPKYRGASPIQATILNGDKETGITVMLMNEKMDEGDLLAQSKVKIEDTDTFETLAAKMALKAADLLNQVLHVWVWSRRIKPTPQDHEKATYTKILTKEDGLIDLQNPPKNLDNMIRAYHPWPGVWGYLETKSEKLKAKNKLIVKLLPGKMIQLEGKQAISLKQFQSGHPDFKLDW